MEVFLKWPAALETGILLVVLGMDILMLQQAPAVERHAARTVNEINIASSFASSAGYLLSQIVMMQHIKIYIE